VAKEMLAVQVGEAAQAFQSAVDAMDEAVAGRLGINQTDLRCLELLAREEPVTAGRLAGALGLTTGSVTAMLDRLEKLGYATRSPDPTDRRKVLVRPTPKALQKSWEIYGPLAAEGERDIVTRYSKAELELVLDFLNRSRELQERHLARLHDTTGQTP